MRFLILALVFFTTFTVIANPAVEARTSSGLFGRIAGPAAGGSVATSTQLPVADFSTLAVGATWTWQYFENDRVYSTERYTLIARESGNVIWLEMSSAFPTRPEFRATHRLKVPWRRCLEAHAAPGARPWSFDMFDWTGTTWEKIEPPSTLAFEEKFNCDPHVHADGSIVTRFNGPLFSQTRRGRDDATWFFSDGTSAGVAAEKFFPHAAGQPAYAFRFLPAALAVP